MKASFLAVGLLSALLCPSAFAQALPCGMAPPDLTVDLTDQAARELFVSRAKHYLRSAADVIHQSGDRLCLDEVLATTDTLNSQAFVAALQLTPADARNLRNALQSIRDNAAKKQKVADQTRKAQVELKVPDGDAAAAAKKSQAVKTATADVAAVKSTQDSAAGAGTTVENALGDGARYSIYAGPAYTLTPDGSWSSGFDTVFRSETAPKGTFRGYFQLSYTTRGGPKAEDGEPDEGAETEPGETAPEFVSPFDAEGGIVNIQTGGNWMLLPEQYDWLGLSGRLGYESLPTEKDSGGINTFKPFVSAGLVTRTIYTDQHSLGQLFLGYSRDYRWDKDLTGEPKNRYDRVVFSGLLELFQVSKATIATRLFASMPVSGKGDTEFRISILAGFKLEDIAQTLGSP